MAVDSARSAQPVPAAPAERAGDTGVAVVEDGAAEVAAGQERRTAFLTALRADLERMVGEEFAETPYAGAACPLIDYYLDHYETAPLGTLRTAAVRMAGSTEPDAAGLRAKVVDAARRGVRDWRTTGALPPLPDWLPAPPTGLARWLGLAGGGGGLHRKAAGGAGGRGTPPGGALARLGAGRRLPDTLRSRLERSAGTPLGDVRVHTEAPAARLADDERAHALTVGTHIAFAAGAWQPGTPAGDALLAHEAAHVAQQRGSGVADAGAESAADRAAVGFLGGRPQPPAGAGGGLRLQRCGTSSTPEYDWRGAARVEVTGAVEHIRKLQAELDKFATGDLTPAAAQRIEEIQRELVAEVERLRSAGVRLDLIALLRAVQTGQDLLRVTGRIDGADPPRLHFGERRQLRLLLDWMPQHTDVRTAWISELEVPATQPPPAAVPGTAFEKPLNDRFWAGYEHGARVNLPLGGKPLPRVKVWAYVYVGSNATPEAQLTTPWFDVAAEPPDRTAIDSPRILSGDPQQATLLADTPAPPPGAPKPIPKPDLVLRGATIPFVLSWVPPLGWGTGRGYRVTWAVSDPDKTLDEEALKKLAAKGEGERQPQTQNTVFTHKFGSTGDHVVYVVLQPGGTEETEGVTEKGGNLPERAYYLVHRAAGQFLVGSRPVQVVDVSTMADEQLARGTGQPPRSLADFMGDLDQQITATTEAMEGGTLAPRELKAQKKRLTEHRDAIEKNFGKAGTMQPFPALDTDFRKDTGYVTPLPSAYAHPDIGGAQPLATYVRVRWAGTSWEAVLIDATTSEILLRSGTGDTPAAALRGALADWAARNDFPTGGRVAYRFERWGIADSFSTTTTAKTLREWASTILSVVGLIVGVILLLLPEPTSKAGAYALLHGVLGGVAVAGMVGGILLGGYEIYRNLSLGRPLLSERNALEALGIIASVLGLRGARMLRAARPALAAGAADVATLRQIKMGERLIVASAGIDVGTFVEVSYSALSQLQDIAHDESIPESEREQIMLSTIGRVAIQGLLLVGSNKDLFGRMIGGRRQAGVLARRLAEGSPVELDPYNRALLQIELRNLGLEPKHLAGLDDAGLIRLLTGVQELHASRPGAGVLGSAYGKGITKLQPTELPQAQFRTALRGVAVPSALKYKFNSRTGAATMSVALPGGGTHTVEIIFVQYPRGGVAPASPHDRPGEARLAIQEVSRGRYSATVYVHDRLSAADAALLAGVELREIAEIVRGYPASGASDFAAHRAAQQRPAIFYDRSIATAAATPTAEDQSSAYLLRELWRSSGLEGKSAADIPPGPVRDRLDQALSELGFGQAANHEDMVKALKGILGDDASPTFVDFVRGFRGRRLASAKSVLSQVATAAVAGPEWNSLRSRLTGRGLSTPDANVMVTLLAGTGRTPAEAAHVGNLTTDQLRQLLPLDAQQLARVLTVDPALLPEALSLSSSPADQLGGHALDALILRVDTPWVEQMLRQPPGSPNRTQLGAMARDALAAEQLPRPTQKWSETKFSQPQLEANLDQPGSGFERLRHPNTGNRISEPGFREGVSLDRGRPKTSAVKTANVTYPDVYGTPAGTTQAEAMELKTVGLGDTVASHFRRPDVVAQIVEQHGGRIRHLPAGTPSYLVVDIRQSGQSIAEALRDLSAVLKPGMRDFWAGVRFMTGPVTKPVLSATYQIP